MAFLLAVQAENCRSLGTSTCLANCLATFGGWAEPAVEEVGHGPKLRRALGAQGLRHRPGAATTATHQGNFDRILFAGIHPWGRFAWPAPRRPRCRRTAANLAPRGSLFAKVKSVHDRFRCGGPCLGHNRRNPTTAARRSSVSLRGWALSSAVQESRSRRPTLRACPAEVRP